MLSFKIDYLAESGVDALHDQNVTAGFRQYVHACADDIVIYESMQILRWKFWYLFGEVSFTQDAGKGVAGLISVWSYDKGLFVSFGVDKEDPSFEDVSFFEYVFYENTLSFERIRIVEFIEYFSCDGDGVLIGISYGEGVSDGSCFFLLLNFQKFAKGRVVVMHQGWIRVHEHWLGDLAGLDLFSIIAHLFIKNIIQGFTP